MNQCNLSNASLKMNAKTKDVAMSAITGRKICIKADCNSRKISVDSINAGISNLTNLSSILKNNSVPIKLADDLTVCNAREQVRVEFKKQKLDFMRKEDNGTLQESVNLQKEKESMYIQMNLKKKKHETLQHSANIQTGNIEYINDNIQKQTLIDRKQKTEYVITVIDDNSIEEITGNGRTISCQTIKCSLLSIESIKNHDKAMQFYTGLESYDKFLYVFKSLGPDAHDLLYYHSNQQINLGKLDQFLMTLLILRQHKSHYEISILFDVSLKEIKNIFITWIRFMKLEWSTNVILPEFYMHLIQLSNFMNDNGSPDLRTKSNFVYRKEPEVIDLESQDESPDKIKEFKKIYKILNGPQNYIESHLMPDIVLVCHVLCYFKSKQVYNKNGLLVMQE